MSIHIGYPEVNHPRAAVLVSADSLSPVLPASMYPVLTRRSSFWGSDVLTRFVGTLPSQSHSYVATLKALQGKEGKRPAQCQPLGSPTALSAMSTGSQCGMTQVLQAPRGGAQKDVPCTSPKLSLGSTNGFRRPSWAAKYNRIGRALTPGIFPRGNIYVKRAETHIGGIGAGLQEENTNALHSIKLEALL